MNKENNIFKDILFIFPIMAYFVLESLIVSFFILLVWTLVLRNYLGSIGYFQIAGIYWIAKMLLFDVFKLIAGLKTVGSNMQNEMEEQNKEFEDEI